ncbi:MAG: DUF3226 domain-containing protein [Bacteroidia bacterium]|nr:DUF3226 domain-containing protein [Bacteroidia bacterium]
MSSRVRIFVEGKTDKELLEAVLAGCFPHISTTVDIKPCGGLPGLSKQRPQLQENTDNGGINLIVFDADNNPEQRRQDLIQQLADMGQSCPIFLFPDNQSPGQQEALLREMATISDFFTCWDHFQQCLQHLNQAYHTDHHQMVYAYEQVYLEKDEMKGPRFQGSAARLWNITPNTPALKALCTFLSSYIR